MTSGTARANAARRASVLIATPSLDDRFAGAYVGGLVDSIGVLSQSGIGVNWAYFSHCPVLSSARAQIVETFLESGASHLLCVDSDHGWSGRDVLRLLSHNAPFAAAAYARWQGGAFDLGEVHPELDQGVTTYPGTVVAVRAPLATDPPTIEQIRRYVRTL